MLKIEDCRRLLGDPSLTDDQVAEVRDAIQAFARLFVDEYLRERAQRNNPEAV